VAVAAQLPRDLGADLLESARAAFVHAFELIAGISAAMSLAVALLAVLLLRGLVAQSSRSA
jgi:hypothetical protein